MKQYQCLLHDGSLFDLGGIKMPSKYKQVFNNTGQHVGLLKPSGTLIEANETILDFGGVDRDDVIGKKFWETYWFKHSSVVQNQIRDDIRKAAGGEHVSHNVAIQGAEDTAVVNNSIRPLVDNRGTVTQLISEGYCVNQLAYESERAQRIRRDVSHPNLLVSYSNDAEESIAESIIHAFLAVNVDVFSKDSTLHEWIDIDALNGFDWKANPPHVITTQIWEYTVRISAENIEIYTSDS